MQTAAEPGGGEAPDIFAGVADAPRIGSYELVREIGRGGMGVMYEATQLDTGRLVALKVLQSHIAHQRDLLARFRREAKAAARLDHPHVLPIYEVNDEADGVPFFTMKLATGGSLVDRRASLAGQPREVAALIAKVARAAHHAHERGVLHRDLKPGNILFDAEGEPMVSDFGLATWLHQDSDLTQTIMVFGTPGYLPPEYLDGRPDVVHATSDIYSLGVILFELLAGRLPIPAASSLEGARRAIERPAPALRQVVAHTDRDLEVICARCLEADPGLRYRTAAALAEDLERWLAGRAILARPVSLPVRAWKLCRRRPVAFFGILLIVCLLVGGFALNRSRSQISAQLQTATAYDRTAVLLPVEDLDTLSFDSDLARESAAALAECVSRVPTLSARPCPEAPEPLPRGGELASFSKRVGGRYLLSSTVRRRGAAVRLVVHVVDAAEDKILHREIVETDALRGSHASATLEAAIRGITGGWPAAPKLAAEADLPAPTDETKRLVASYLRAGDEHYQRLTLADAELAITAYRKALSFDPENVEALASLANVMTYRASLEDRSKWLAAALPLALRATELDPMVASGPQTLSMVYSALGQPEAALDQALSAFELDREAAWIVNTVAEAYFDLGKTDLALLWNRRLDRRDHGPGNTVGYRADYLASVGDFNAARRAYQELVEFRPELPDGQLGIANVDFLEGKKPQALERARALQQRFPSDHSIIRYLAALELFVGTPDEAARLFQKIEDDDLGLGAYLSVRRSSGLGYLALLRGDPAGRRIVARALELDEQELADQRHDSHLLFERAANHAMLGNIDAALASLEQAAVSGHWTFFHMSLDPRLTNLRKEKRFDGLLSSLEQRMRELRLKCQVFSSDKPKE